MQVCCELLGLARAVPSMCSVGVRRDLLDSQGLAKTIALAALQLACNPPQPIGINGQVNGIVPSELDCGGGTPFNSMVEPRSPEQQVLQQRRELITNSPEVKAATRLLKRRGIIDPPSISRPRRVESARLFQEGLGHYGGQAYAVSAKKFKQSLKQNPFFVPSKYFLAKSYALLGEREAALQTLAEMYSWNDTFVSQQLVAARDDNDLKTLRDDVRFKVMTGYRRITLLNGAGDAGAPAVKRIALEFIDKNYQYPTQLRIGADKTLRLYPVIYYRPIFRAQAEEFLVILDNENTRLAEITWDTRDDFIITYGESSVAETFAASEDAEPIKQGTPAKELAADEDALGDAIGAVQDAKGKAEELKGTGEELATPPAE